MGGMSTLRKMVDGHEKENQRTKMQIRGNINLHLKNTYRIVEVWLVCVLFVYVQLSIFI